MKKENVFNFPYFRFPPSSRNYLCNIIYANGKRNADFPDRKDAIFFQFSPFQYQCVYSLAMNCCLISQFVCSFNGVPAEERLHWRSFLVKLGSENLKGVKNEELLVACHKYIYLSFLLSMYLITNSALHFKHMETTGRFYYLVSNSYQLLASANVVKLNCIRSFFFYKILC